MRCNYSDESWTLVCGDDGHWQNEAGNCSDATPTTLAAEVATTRTEFPVSLMVAIAVGVGLGIVVGLVCLGVFVVSLKW